MPLIERLAELLGLGSDATEDAVMEAVTSLNAQGTEGETALNAQIGQIGVALGLSDDAEFEAVLNAAETAAKDQDEVFKALNSELATVSGELKELKDERLRDKAEAFVDGAIKKGTVGVKPQRDRYISMHMRDAEETEALINTMPALGPSGVTVTPPPAKDGEVSLNHEQRQAAKLLGISEDKYLEQLKADQAAEETF